MCLSEVSISKDFLISNPWNLSASTRLGASESWSAKLSPAHLDARIRQSHDVVRGLLSACESLAGRIRMSVIGLPENQLHQILSGSSSHSLFLCWSVSKVKSSTFSDTPRCSSRSPPRRLISRLQKSDTTTLWRRKKAQLQWLRESPVFVSQEPLNS